MLLHPTPPPAAITLSREVNLLTYFNWSSQMGCACIDSFPSNRNLLHSEQKKHNVDPASNSKYIELPRGLLYTKVVQSADRCSRKLRPVKGIQLRRPLDFSVSRVSLRLYINEDIGGRVVLHKLSKMVTNGVQKPQKDLAYDSADH